MCGIAGFSWSDQELVTRMTQKLAHRGPDQHGIYTDDFVSLGHRRLSILDLSEHGRQPMSNPENSIWITYNGEIYNFKELRGILERKGYHFRSGTDTEVILYSYQEYGSACVQMLNGMFAFAIWDKNKQELFLARDRLGIKPLYYYLHNGKIIFASEIKAILEAEEVSREINLQALYNYVGYEFIPAPDTIFRLIHKLPPGHHLHYRNGQAEIAQYWNLQFVTEPEPKSYYEDKLVYFLEDAVKQHLMSDVPLGVFLSGGLDSSALVAMMVRCGVAPIRTFSLGYKEVSFSELNYSQIISKKFNTEHRVLMIEPITPELLETAIWHLDEPMTDLSAIPFYLISRKARERVTVCLSGEGGDEVLVGYDRFKASKAHGYYSVIPEAIRRRLIAPLLNALPGQAQKKGAVNMLKRFIQGGLLPREGGHIRWQYFMGPEQDQKLFSKELLMKVDRTPFAPISRHISGCNSSDRLDREIYIDLRFFLPDSPLMKVDKMSMAHGLEVRVPFLDYRFVEFCATIPSEYKLKGFTTKAILRSAMSEILPREILNRGKQGYGLPIKSWLRQRLRDYMIESVNASRVIKEQFNLNYVNQLIQEHVEYRADHSHVLWSLINLAVWYRLFVEARR